MYKSSNELIPIINEGEINSNEENRKNSKGIVKMDDKIKELLNYLTNSRFTGKQTLEPYVYKDRVNAILDGAISIIKKNFVKKAFISQPMNGLSEDQIMDVRNKAKETLESLGYEVVNSYFETSPDVKNIGVYMLGDSLRILSDCDIIFMCNGWSKARGCIIEHDVAVRYNITVMYQNKDSETEAMINGYI